MGRIDALELKLGDETLSASGAFLELIVDCAAGEMLDHLCAIEHVLNTPKPLRDLDYAELTLVLETLERAAIAGRTLLATRDPDEVRLLARL